MGVEHYQDKSYLDDVFGKNPPPVKRTVYPLVFDDQLHTIEKPDWLITGILPTRSLGVIHGQPGCCKTFLALDWGLSVAKGFDWRGRSVQQGNVVYVLAEGWHGLSSRVEAWKANNGVLSDDRSGVAFLGRPIRLIDSCDIAAFGNSIEAMGVYPTLVVVDTLARNSTGIDENSAKEMGQIISNCDLLRQRFDCAVLLVHHSTKGGLSAPTLRGSSALNGAADTVVSVKKDEADPSLTLVGCEKQKDYAPFPLMRFRLAPVGNSVVLVPDGKASTFKQEALEFPE